ncbi:hypothetical protein CGRA01v4_15015 [Colletotrichum graminicola]|uniref:Uncharacterized protein n=1 Tax=Colletotrichum graminicola (strain M1.001 / M2 / FGSC 10212) TaxID=645133 RepID=E3R108_COLGM|nr:uncharacterized protein GLRG_11942 [Colletotrichum graminicola M1.001]EFQ36796.1 hypothetical protein GLRG_11942 [Colletotrichum graminicola M1.001]WDK23723.1 hypothetical protein CGRA01v4_15015 [Colletotrichum graminicola]
MLGRLANPDAQFDPFHDESQVTAAEPNSEPDSPLGTPSAELESPFSTPPPEEIRPWTENETGRLVAFLRTAREPLSVGETAEHMSRSLIDTAAMVVCLWLSAIRTSEARGSRIAWWVGRPIFNSTGLGRVTVFCRDGSRVMMRLYDANGRLDAEGSIESPSQMYDEGTF